MDPLSLTQWIVQQRLLQDPTFRVANIPVITEDIGDIENAIETKLAEIGICVVVLTVTADIEVQEPPEPYLKIKIVVSVRENVVMNRSQGGTGYNARQIACICAAMLHNFVPPQKSSSIIGGTNNFIALMPEDSQQGRLVYDLEFFTHSGIDYDPSKPQNQGMLNPFPPYPV